MPETAMLKAAQEYASLGWPIFPARHDKTPYTPHGVLDATTDPAQIEKWWNRWPGANIALAVGEAGLLVLDYDPGSSAEDVEHAVSDLPETNLVAKTPRGGTHEYFALNKGDPPVASRVQPFAEHVDTRSFRGYVLLPPSATKDGPYEWVSRGKPAMRSVGLLEACGKAREKDRDRDVWHIEADLPENIELARDWLAGKIKIGNSYCKPAIKGSGGDKTTYATGAMMKSCGLSEGTALELMWEVWNPQFTPNWEYERLAEKVAHAYKYNTSPPGNVTPAYHVAQIAGAFEPAKKETLGEGLQVSKGRFRAIDWQGLQSIEPPKWLIPDTLPEDAYGMLIGAPQSYKTFIALDMALTVATGGGLLQTEEWQGRWDAPRKPGPVLFIAGEGRAGLRQRAEAWAFHHLGPGIKNVPGFVLADPVPHIYEEEASFETFLEVVQDHHEKFRLVVLDTVARAMQGTNENDQKDATAFTKMVDTLRYKLDCAVLALHHSGHENKERGRGSSAFSGDADTLLISSRQDKNLTKLSMTKQKDWPEWTGPLWCALEPVTLPDGRDTLVSTRTKAPAQGSRDTKQEKVTLATLDQHVLAALKRHEPEGELTTSQLARYIATEGMKTEAGDMVPFGRGEKTIRGGGTISLQALAALGSGARVQGMYDPKKDRWRYCPQAAASFKRV